MDVTNEIEMRYKGIRGLLSLAHSEREISRGCFTGIDDDLVSFAGRGLDEVVDVFRRTVDEYFAGHATEDVQLRRIAIDDPMENRGKAGKPHLVGAREEFDEMELDDLLDKVERLGFLISKRLGGRNPGKIVESVGGAVAHGVERACRETRKTLREGRRTERPWHQRKGSGSRASATAF